MLYVDVFPYSGHRSNKKVFLYSNSLFCFPYLFTDTIKNKFPLFMFIHKYRCIYIRINKR